jgi:polyisoprenoid-binding protein YceI
MATLDTADAVQHSDIEQTRRRIDPARSRVAFRARTYWGLMTVIGEFECYTGTLDLEAQPVIELTIDAASLNTRNKLRDRHLRSADFFDVALHPDVCFTSETPALDGEQLKVRGQLEAAGHSITLELSALLRRVRDELEIDSTALVDHEQLGMSWSRLGLIPTPTELIVHGRLLR